MAYWGYAARILFVILVAVAFNYKDQIKEVVYPSKQTPSENVAKTLKPATKEPLKPPNSDYYDPPFDPSNPSDPILSKSGARLITRSELAAHGHSGPLKPIWLAVVGRVFDVDKGADDYYGPDGGYKFFTGTAIHVLKPLALTNILVVTT